MAVEEGQLLLAVGRVVGGIEVDRDAPRTTLEAPPMMRDDRGGQHVPHGDQLAPPDGILEPRQRWLRGQRRPGDRIPLQQQLVHGIVGQPSSVVAVGVPAGQPEDPLPEQLERLVVDLARLTVVVEARGHALGQLQLGVDALQQDGPAVGAGMRLIEDGDDGLSFRIEVEPDLRYTGCSHRVSSRWCIESLRHRFYSTGERLGGSFLSSFANFPG